MRMSGKYRVGKDDIVMKGVRIETEVRGAMDTCKVSLVAATLQNVRHCFHSHRL